ncbi:NepR family anti-sigma factor [uncultured Ferrovibrio sp.]|jgi:hypothetical protein|uniref:NepR family anti-sigma factor n=1 Tax=uncultured Ferrovibrio sp. TaxID=1576913 RepID=UPI00261474E0|nr:NepR family anti-sigma factor [uncultured Ferrovibrio sp.]
MSDSEERAARTSRKSTPVGSMAPEAPDNANVDWLGRSLKQLFEDIAKEPIPQRIMDKLKELDAREEGKHEA